MISRLFSPLKVPAHVSPQGLFRKGRRDSPSGLQDTLILLLKEKKKTGLEEYGKNTVNFGVGAAAGFEHGNGLAVYVPTQSEILINESSSKKTTTE